MICPLHAYKFDLATGEPLGNVCSRSETYRIRGRRPDRRVLLWLDAGRARWSGDA